MKKNIYIRWTYIKQFFTNLNVKEIKKPSDRLKNSISKLTLKYSLNQVFNLNKYLFLVS